MTKTREYIIDMNILIILLSIIAATQVFAASPNDETMSLQAQQIPLTWAELGLMQGFPPPADKLVTRKNWQNPPFNRWAFQHMDQVLRTAHLSRGSGPIAELPLELRDISRLTFKTKKGEHSSVNEMLNSTYTDSFIVLKDGRIAFEAYFNGMSRDKRHIIQSTSKSLTGSAATILIHEGRLRPSTWQCNADINRQLYSDAGAAKMNIRVP